MPWRDKWEIFDHLQPLNRIFHSFDSFLGVIIIYVEYRKYKHSRIIIPMIVRYLLSTHVHVLSLGENVQFRLQSTYVQLSLLTYGAEAVNDGRDGGDSFAGTLERLVLTQLCADCRGYQGEGSNDETT